MSAAPAGAMVVLDTHAWIWLSSDPSKLSRTAAAAIDAAGTIGVPSISCWEVSMLAAAGRIELDQPVTEWVRLALAQPGILALPLTPPVAVAAGLLDRDAMPGDPADRMIYATARAAGAALLTRDAALRKFDPRGTLW